MFLVLRRTRQGMCLVAATALLTLTPSLAGCGQSEEDPDRVALLLFDVSRSTAGSRPRELYRKVFSRVLDVVAEDGGIIAADIIDSNPLAHSDRRFKTFFDTFNFATDNTDEFEEDRDVLKAEATAAAENFISAQPGQPGSAILDALTLAEDFFASYSDAKQTYLVILSDMVEESDRYEFTDQNLAPGAVQQLIASDRSAGDLPDLTGVEVYVVGAGVTGGSTDLKPRKIRAVERFWLEYVDATGAHLLPARYGPSLVRFP